ncbi:MAG: dihydropteridine reductase [Clostridia bacterium]|nr:dihydropteridine reductase [Clostridia bacterium]
MNRNDQNFIAQKIRTQYMEQQPSELDELRQLDAAVKRPANIFAYIFGSIGAVIMGAGMSLVMTDLGSTLGMADPMVPGIIVGIAGMVIALLNYPIYKNILASRKAKYADKILALSEKIINH